MGDMSDYYLAAESYCFLELLLSTAAIAYSDVAHSFWSKCVVCQEHGHIYTDKMLFKIENQNLCDKCETNKNPIL